MKAAVLEHIAGAAGWLTGPIFSKELRVSSRRRRNYVLRFIYLGLLTVFVVLVWLSQVKSSAESSAFRISRMSEAGRVVIMAVTWFQFCALQLVAVVMLSASISGEVYDRTLGILLTTPIRMFQVVMGKLLSKLLQLMILLAISMPLLAVVRVFGGVPWDFVLASLCITLFACLVAGAVSMFFSILFRRAFVTIIVTLGAGFVLYAVLPWMLMLVFMALAFSGGGPPGSAYRDAVMGMMHGNPFAMLFLATGELMQPGSLGRMGFFSWPLHCGIMLAFTVLMLFLCVLLVRRVALRQAAGDTGVVRVVPQLPPAPVARAPGQAAPGVAGAPPLPVPVLVPTPVAEAQAGRIRRLTGSPLLWKELRTPLTRSTVKKVVGIVIPLSILSVMYLLVGALGQLDEESTHIGFVVVYLIGGALITAVVAASPITAEKESRCWPLLLSTPLSEGHIVWAKAAGVLRKCWFGWAPLMAHLLVFAVVGYIHPIALLHLLILVVWVVAFLTGAGLYFGARFRRTTTAVVMNLGLGIALWVVLPVLLLIVVATFEGGHEDIAGVYAGVTNPVVQGIVLLAETAGADNAGRPLAELSYNWPWDGPGLTAGDTTALMLLFASVHSFIGFLFALRAMARLRRNIF